MRRAFRHTELCSALRKGYFLCRGRWYNKLTIEKTAAMVRRSFGERDMQMRITEEKQ